MKRLILIAFLFVAGSSDICSAAPEAEKQPPAAPASQTLEFQSYDKAPEGFSFAVKVGNLSKPTEFLRIGETVGGTKLKLTKFESKTALNPKNGVEQDVSELTLTDSETHKTIILVISQPKELVLGPINQPSK